MADVEVNLTGLSEKELLHIKEVLSRDRKLQESKHFIRPTVDDKPESTRNHMPANELVMAEIERVHRQSPKSDNSGMTTPARSDADSNGDGFLASFADMITRGMEAIDFTASHKKGHSALSALAGAVMSMDTSRQQLSDYSPLESTKKKPTLLELAAKRRSSAAPSMTSVVDENGNPAIKGRRGNAMSSSLPDSQTLPRSYRTGRATVESPVPSISTTSSPRAQRRALPRTPVKLAKSLPKSPHVRSPKTFVSIENEEKESPHKQTTWQGFSEGEKKETYSPPEKHGPHEQSMHAKRPDAFPTASKLVILSHAYPDKDNRVPETIEETSQKSIPTSRDQTEFFMRKYDNYSPLEDETETDQHADYDYEPDTESVDDADSRGFTDNTDDVSLNSMSSSFLGSPMKGRNSDFVQDSWEESDASSGVFVGQLNVANFTNEGHLIKHVSPGNRKPRWVKSPTDKRLKKNTRTESAGSEKAIAQAPIISPSLSTRSVPNSVAQSPVLRHEGVQNLMESTNTVGHIDVSLVYYSADSFTRKKMSKTDIPSYGTKSQTEQSCHVLSRREYTEVTNAELELSTETKSGAPEKMDGELHLTVKGAKFQDSSGKIKSPNTYVKCYLLPDKFHHSKMKSAVIKKSKEPKWDHKFVLAGFTQSELRDRSLEIIVGSWHFKKQEVLGGAILSVGQGSELQPWIKSSKSEAYLWKTALQISGSKVKSLLPLRAHMKPTYL